MKNLLTTLFLLVSVAQGALALTRNQGEVTVHAHGPAGLRIEGKSAEVSLEEEASALVFRVPLAPIDTGIGLRNRHLREALEAEKFPTASLRVARASLTVPTDAAPLFEGTATGELTLHGQVRPVSVRYRAQRVAGITSVQGSLRIDVTEFGVQLPSYLGITVAPEVEVDVDLAVALP
jgi:polyisoprenoid-binding protein YceI